MIKDKFNELFFPHDSKAEHFKALDGLRGIAVLFVLLSHTSNANILFHEFLNFRRIGQAGVFLFFVLSAYLLDRQIALALMSKKYSIRYWLNYFLRRFLRIYPLFAIALLLYGFVNYIGIETVIDRVGDIRRHLLLRKGESVFGLFPLNSNITFFHQ